MAIKLLIIPDYSYCKAAARVIIKDQKIRSWNRWLENAQTQSLFLRRRTLDGGRHAGGLEREFKVYSLQTLIKTQ